MKKEIYTEYSEWEHGEDDSTPGGFFVGLLIALPVSAVMIYGCYALACQIAEWWTQ